jgi:3-hydroxybutyryl-CoA dehydrogenase
MINQAIYCLSEGVADAEKIDEAMEIGTNMPMGPLRLADHIGLDTCLQVLQNLYKRTNDPKYVPCPLLKDLVERGHLGKKTRKGIRDLY